MVISQAQLALLIMVVTGAIGARRGWGRELITCAIVLGTLLVLQLQGLSVVTNLFVNGMTAGASAAGSASCGASGGASSLSSASTSTAVSDLIFGAMVLVGYYAGSRHGPPIQTASHRLVGIIPGVITGGTISYYLNSILYPGAQLFLTGLSTISFLAALPALLVLGLSGVLLLVAFSRQPSKSSK